MKSFMTVVALGLGLIATAAAQPTISANGVVNVASYSVPGLPNASIAQGSIFVVFGTNLGQATVQKASAFPIATNLGGTSVTITAGGQTLPAPMIYTTATQVAAIMPSTTPVGAATVTVTYNGATSGSQAIQVVTSSFGTFSLNQQGNGSGIITNTNYQVFLGNSAARPGDAAIIWGTGLGPVSFSDAGQPQATNLTSIPVQVYVGGKVVPTVYQGRSGCCSGLDQIVFTVPAGVEGCSVPVLVKINQVVSNTTTMPVTTSSNRVCSDPNGLSSSDLQLLLSKGTFNFGFISLDRNTTTNALPANLGGGTTTTDFGSAGFFSLTPTSFAGGTTGIQQTSIGACIVYTFTSSGGSTVPTINFAGLDAGQLINVNGPNGLKQLTAEANTKGFYSGELSSGTPPNPVILYLDGGTYKIDNSAGGADVKAFSFNLNVGAPLVWTNMSAVSASSINRAQGVTVTWTGGAPGTYVEVTGSSILTGPPAVVATFTCMAPVSAGTFTVGPEVLLQLPASTVISAGGFSFSTSDLAVANISNPVKFTATGLDYGYATSSVSSGTTVTYQ